MASVSPVAVAMHNGDAAELRPVTHRTKHRKEVKRYHQRQLNKQLREEAKTRDAQLFLFERTPNGATETVAESAAAAVPALTENTAKAATQRPSGGTGTVRAIADKEATSRASEALVSSPPPRSPPPPPPASGLVGAPLPHRALSSWDFDFVLRKPATAASAEAEAAAVVSSAAQTSNDAPVETEGVAADSAHGVSAVAPSGATPQVPPPNSLVPATRRRPEVVVAPPDRDSGNTAGDNRPSGNSDLISVLPIDNTAVPAFSKVLSNAKVQRVEGLSAIPMETPLRAGTDLNRPPRSYLTLDPIFNVHQHAPGFVRDQRIALQHMLHTAMSNWEDMQQNALIVTSAEAMRTIFEQAYVPSRPLALRVRRIGPTIVIDSRATPPTQVEEMRQQALFSKALYLMKETHGRDVAADEAAHAAQLALALPERRLCSVSASDPTRFGVNLHRYSQLLQWRIDTTELLVGNDAPVVLDQRTGMEQLVRLKAADQADSTDAEQRETLQCWFDAMLANVPHVGTYFHCDGTLLSYQVKKTSDLLGYVEARLAGAALNFTSTTLQWIVKHCHRDNGTYAVFRDFTMDYLRLYEIPDMEETADFVAETERYFSPSPAPADQPDKARARASHDGDSSGSGAEADAASGAYAGYGSNKPRLSRFALNFGRTCFHIGQHLYREGGVSRANDALTLLHRSLRVFLPCCASEAVARETVVEVVEMLPALVSRKLHADAASIAAASTSSNNNNNSSGGGGAEVCDKGFTSVKEDDTPAGFVTASCSSPELYRDGLMLCGSFEIPLRRAFTEAGGGEGDPLVQAFYARCLVASSAAVCSVVATTLGAYYSGCHHLRVLRKARAEGRSKDGKVTALRGIDYREDVMTSLATMLQDLLQVVVEGLVRLEETSALISPLHAAEAAPTTTTTTTTTMPSTATAAATATITTAAKTATVAAPQDTVAVPPHSATPWAVPTSALPSTASRSTAAAAAATSGGAGGHLQGTKEEMSSAGRSSSSAASESMASAASSTHVDGADRPKRTSSPARVAVAAAQNCGTVLDPRTQVDTTPLRSALCELYGDVVMIAMADTTSGFTKRTLAELGTRLEARAQATSRQLPTTLLWLTSLKVDVVSLSFTALRFYGRVASHTRRHLVKLAQVYYLVGKEHHRTARYTKALEALHRAKSLLQAAHKAPEDVAFGDAFSTHGMMQWADVMRLLGDVYRSVVERKLETAPGVAAATVAQPLLVGPLHNLPVDADTFFAQALAAYKQGGSDEGCRTAKACTLLVYASVLMERIAVAGQPASHADAQRIAELLRESATLAPTQYVEERDWQTMRLFTVTSPAATDAALTRSVADIFLRSSCVSRSPAPAAGSCNACSPCAVELPKDAMWVDADVVDAGGPRRERMVVPPQCVMIEGAQKALVCCVMVEHVVPARTGDAVKKNLSPPPLSDGKYRNLLRWIGKATAFMTNSLRTFLCSKEVWRNAAVRHQWLSTLRTWGEHTVGGCLHHIVCLMALRLFNAAQAHLPAPKQQEARNAFKEVTSMLERISSTAPDSEERYEQVLKELKDLHTLLTPFVDW